MYSKVRLKNYRDTCDVLHPSKPSNAIQTRTSNSFASASKDEVNIFFFPVTVETIRSYPKSYRMKRKQFDRILEKSRIQTSISQRNRIERKVGKR